MGLDIFVRKGKRHSTGTINGDYDAIADDKKQVYLKKLGKWAKKEYASDEKSVKSFYRIVNEYDSSAWQYEEWDGKKWVNKLHTDSEVREVANNILSKKFEDVYAEADLYYRKVNFLYAFFSDSIDYDTQMARFTKDDANRLVSLCDSVLGNKDNAKNYLPAQSGFFFGSTDYDDYYFDSIKKVRKDFSKLVSKWKDDEIAIIYFSW